MPHNFELGRNVICEESTISPVRAECAFYRRGLTVIVNEVFWTVFRSALVVERSPTSEC